VLLAFVLTQGLAATSQRTMILTAIEISVAVALGVIGLSAIIARPSRLSDRAEPSRVGDNRAGFVMETFEQVLRQLKEKEADLDRLRSEAVARADRVESYHQNILQSIASGVITCDERGAITTFNVAAERILGHAADEAIGRPCDEIFGATSPIATMVSRSLADRVPISRREWHFVRGTEPVCVGLSSALLRNRTEAVIGAAVVFTDLTEIKRLEDQVESERRLSVLGEMSAGIAHEFRNYMGTILGWAKLLAKRLPESHDGRPMVGAIIKELSVMQRLIDDLLAFGRDLEPQRQPVDVRELLNDAALLRPGRTDVRVVVTVAPDVPAEAAWDPTLMRQALKNLVQNAAEAMSEGGGTVTFGIARSATEPGAVEVVVGDTGVGIPATFLDRIFLPFFTLKAKGHGLGLALVHKIVLAHEGRIRVESQEGRGTTFTVTVPLAASASSAQRTRWVEAA
jgi:two-component system sensor histidine kinase PilS (NtrC family)